VNRPVIQECCLQRIPRGFGARETQVRIKQDPDSGLHVVSAADEEDEGLAAGDGVRVVRFGICALSY